MLVKAPRPCPSFILQGWGGDFDFRGIAVTAGQNPPPSRKVREKGGAPSVRSFLKSKSRQFFADGRWLKADG